MSLVYRQFGDLLIAEQAVFAKSKMHRDLLLLPGKTIWDFSANQRFVRQQARHVLYPDFGS